MKKLLLMLVACFVAIATNAQNPALFLRGAINGWGTGNDYQFTENNGVYTLTLSQLSGEFKIADSTWGSYNYGAGSDAVVAVGKTITLSNGSQTNLNCGGMTISNVTLTFTLSSATLVVTGTAKENDYTCVYLVGDFGEGWNENITNYPLNLKSGTTNTYEGKYTLSAETTYFKMKAGTLVYGTGGDDISVVLGTPYSASQSGNAFSIGAGEYTFTYVLEKNAATGTITVTGEGDAPVNPNPGATTLYLIGSFNDWGLADSQYAFTDKGNNVYELKLNSLNGEFKVNDGTWSGVNLGGTGVTGEENEVVDAVIGDNTLWQGSSVNLRANNWTNVTLTLNYTSGAESATLNITADGNDGPIDPNPGDNFENWFVNIVGDYCNNDFMDSACVYGVPDSNGMISFEEVPIGTGSFQVKTWNGSVDGWYSNQGVLPLKEWVQLVDSQEVGSTIEGAQADYTYNIEFNCVTNQIRVALSKTSAVEAIEAAEAEAVYFNLQGQKVNNPDKGIFVKVVNGKALKVVK